MTDPILPQAHVHLRTLHNENKDQMEADILKVLKVLYGD